MERQMNKKEQAAFKLLLKIAERQQHIIEKLAQTVAENPAPKPGGTDPNVEFLMRAIPVAAANAGINNVIVTKVDTHPTVSSGGGATMATTYMVHMTGVPAKMGDTFKKVWDTQLSTQKPELVGKVGFVFAS